MLEYSFIIITDYLLTFLSFDRNSNGVPRSIWPGVCLIIQKMSETKNILTSLVNISLYYYIYIIYL